LTEDILKAMIYKPLALKGFCLTVAALRSKDIFLPVKASTAGHISIEFNAYGKNIFLRLTEMMKDTLNTTAREIYTIGIDVRIKNVLRTYVKRGNSKYCQESVGINNFNNDQDSTDYKHYCLTYNCDTGVVSLKHKNGQGAELQFEDPAPHKSIQYVAVSCWTRPVYYKDILMLS